MIPYSTETSILNEQAFMAFYDTYAPELWGFILKANLPLPKAETILINTFHKVWQQYGPSILGENYLMTQLLKTACQEGLPVECLRAILKPKL